jgi:hypothetical protein
MPTRPRVNSIAIGEVPIEVRKLTNAELSSRFKARFLPVAPPTKGKLSKGRPKLFIKPRPFRRPGRSK